MVKEGVFMNTQNRIDSLFKSINETKTYQKDMPLFKRLNLKPFIIETHRRHYVGEVKMENGSQIKIWVEAYPAQFWFFEIFCADNKKTTRITTGSGSLEDYWGFVEAIATGMIVVDKNFL